MIEFLAFDSPAAIVLAAVASVAWSICLVMTFMRWRAFHQRADLLWMVAYLCLLGAAIGQVWTANAWRSLLLDGGTDMITAPRAYDGVIPTPIVAVDLLIIAFFALAAVLAIFANRRRADAFDV